MISVQLGVSLEEALVRLRAHAFAASTPLDDVAGDVVRRLLRFDPGSRSGSLILASPPGPMTRYGRGERYPGSYGSNGG